jgi:hypothetical protein
MAGIEVTNPAARPARWLKPHHWSIATTSQTATVARVYLLQFQVEVPTTVDGICYAVVATSAGQVRAGIYGPIVTADTCEGAPLVVESAAVAQGSINSPQVVTFTATLLQPGTYYAALEFSDATATFQRGAAVHQVPGAAQRYDRGGGFGALTGPCPAITADSTQPGLMVRTA